MSDEDRIRKMIEGWLTTWGFKAESWHNDADYEEPRPVANIGRFRVLEDDDDQGLYADTEGFVEVSVVGAPEYNNERVALHFTEDGMDEPNGEIRDLDVLEAV